MSDLIDFFEKEKQVPDLIPGRSISYTRRKEPEPELCSYKKAVLPGTCSIYARTVRTLVHAKINGFYNSRTYRVSGARPERTRSRLMVVRILKQEQSATSAQDSIRKIIGSSRTLFIFPNASPHHTAHSQPHTPVHFIPLSSTRVS